LYVTLSQNKVRNLQGDEQNSSRKPLPLSWTTPVVLRQCRLPHSTVWQLLHMCWL